MKKFVSGLDLQKDLICPISQNIMRDPVYIVSDEGIKYEFDRENITKWFEKHETNPLTGLRMTNKSIYSNPDRKKMIKEFIDSREHFGIQQDGYQSNDATSSLTNKDFDMSQELKGAEYACDMPICSEKLLIGIVGHIDYCSQKNVRPEGLILKSYIEKLF